MKETLYPPAREAFSQYLTLGLAEASPYDFLRIVAKQPPADVASLLAVRDTFRFLTVAGKGETCEAVQDVYGLPPVHLSRRQTISLRVRAFATRHFCDERTVYRLLACAGDVYRAYYSTYQSRQAA